MTRQHLRVHAIGFTGEPIDFSFTSFPMSTTIAVNPRDRRAAGALACNCPSTDDEIVPCCTFVLGAENFDLGRQGRQDLSSGQDAAASRGIAW